MLLCEAQIYANTRSIIQTWIYGLLLSSHRSGRTQVFLTNRGETCQCPVSIHSKKLSLSSTIITSLLAHAPPCLQYLRLPHHLHRYILLLIPPLNSVEGLAPLAPPRYALTVTLPPHHCGDESLQPSEHSVTRAASTYSSGISSDRKNLSTLMVTMNQKVRQSMMERDLSVLIVILTIHRCGAEAKLAPSSAMHAGFMSDFEARIDLCPWNGTRLNLVQSIPSPLQIRRSIHSPVSSIKSQNILDTHFLNLKHLYVPQQLRQRGKCTSLQLLKTEELCMYYVSSGQERYQEDVDQNRSQLLLRTGFVPIKNLNFRFGPPCSFVGVSLLKKSKFFAISLDSSDSVLICSDLFWFSSPILRWIYLMLGVAQRE